VTSLRDVSPDDRGDRRIQIGYTMTHPLRSHTFRAGGEARLDRSGGITTGDARGAYVFTGLYSAGSPDVRSSGLDFADFLLGLPQQASVQYAGDVALSGRAFSLFVQDDWRLRGNLTLNLGARYEAVSPYTEAHDRMVNLDVAPDFTAAEPVISGGTGLYTGSFPSSLVNADYNNLAPRVGVAWRMNPRTVLRGGFSTSFNNGSYAAIARQLVAQPPFAVTSTSIGTLTDPLTLSDAFATVDDSTTTNNFGVDKNYQLGVIKTWNVDVNHNFGRGWQVGGGYTGTQGTHLDVVRAPNRDPDGPRIDGVQPFLWQTSEGESILHAGTIRLRKQQARGVGGSVSYTLAKSIDDASSIGGGGRVVAQDDRNLDAEWGLSSFDRRHQVAGNLFVEFPFGPNRRWMNGGGTWAALLRDWAVSMSFVADSGTPFTARLLSATSDAARGTNGTLRADYTGAPISIGQPTLQRFFNTSAFAVPATGAFGSAGRNTIIGPGAKQVDASISRDVRLSNTQVVSIQLQATNLFNTVRFGAIDSVVNSPTFGQVVSIRPMRTVQLGVRFRF
jgi:outer membrane receptor protein involved in Fe transport